MRESLEEFYKEKRVLVTGHTGFKGAWLAIWLHSMGAEVSGLALDPKGSDDLFILSGAEKLLTNDFRADIRDFNLVKEAVETARPEIIFHLAAQPLVSEGYADPLYTYSTNIMGTANMLEAARDASTVSSLLLITSDKCYENTGKREGYAEQDPMGGFDPYSSSKGAAELVISSYHRSFYHKSKSAAIASARAGNVLGGGDRAADRLIPDCVRAFESGKPVTLRNPQFTRPWQHVLDPLGAYLLLAKKLAEKGDEFSGPWNFGPEESESYTVRELAEAFSRAYGKGAVRVEAQSGIHEATYLSLDISKAKERLNWGPLVSFSECIAMTADWYRRSLSEDPANLCLEQIGKYMQLWR